MSSRSVALTAICCAIAAVPVSLCAQDRSTTSAAELAARQRAQLREDLARPEECQPDAMQPDTIVVCGPVERRREQTRRAMSVLPQPIDPQVNQLDGLREPPCWDSGKATACFRGGWAPPPIYLIDLDAIPEALTPEQAEHVYRAEDLPPPEQAPGSAP